MGTAAGRGAQPFSGPGLLNLLEATARDRLHDAGVDGGGQVDGGLKVGPRDA